MRGSPGGKTRGLGTAGGLWWTGETGAECGKGMGGGPGGNIMGGPGGNIIGGPGGARNGGV